MRDLPLNKEQRKEGCLFISILLILFIAVLISFYYAVNN